MSFGCWQYGMCLSSQRLSRGALPGLPCSRTRRCSNLSSVGTTVRSARACRVRLLAAAAPQRLQIVFVSTEVAPWSKVGGLGDVLSTLPVELAARGHRVMTVAPRYANYNDVRDTGVRVPVQLPAPAVQQAQTWNTQRPLQPAAAAAASKPSHQFPQAAAAAADVDTVAGQPSTAAPGSTAVTAAPAPAASAADSAEPEPAYAEFSAARQVVAAAHVQTMVAAAANDTSIAAGAHGATTPAGTPQATAGKETASSSCVVPNTARNRHASYMVGKSAAGGGPTPFQGPPVAGAIPASYYMTCSHGVDWVFVDHPVYQPAPGDDRSPARVYTYRHPEDSTARDLAGCYSVLCQAALAAPLLLWPEAGGARVGAPGQPSSSSGPAARVLEQLQFPRQMVHGLVVPVFEQAALAAAQPQQLCEAAGLARDSSDTTAGHPGGMGYAALDGADSQQQKQQKQEGEGLEQLPLVFVGADWPCGVLPLWLHTYKEVAAAQEEAAAAAAAASQEQARLLQLLLSDDPKAWQLAAAAAAAAGVSGVSSSGESGNSTADMAQQQRQEGSWFGTKGPAAAADGAADSPDQADSSSSSTAGGSAAAAATLAEAQAQLAALLLLHQELQQGLPEAGAAAPCEPGSPAGGPEQRAVQLEPELSGPTEPMEASAAAEAAAAADATTQAAAEAEDGRMAPATAAPLDAVQNSQELQQQAEQQQQVSSKQRQKKGQSETASAAGGGGEGAAAPAVGQGLPAPEEVAAGSQQLQAQLQQQSATMPQQQASVLPHLDEQQQLQGQQLGDEAAISTSADAAPGGVSLQALARQRDLLLRQQNVTQSEQQQLSQQLTAGVQALPTAAAQQRQQQAASAVDDNRGGASSSQGQEVQDLTEAQEAADKDSSSAPAQQQQEQLGAGGDGAQPATGGLLSNSFSTWQAQLGAALAGAKVVFAIHNGGYQGVFPGGPAAGQALGLSKSAAAALAPPTAPGAAGGGSSWGQAVSAAAATLRSWASKWPWAAQQQEQQSEEEAAVGSSGAAAGKGAILAASGQNQQQQQPGGSTAGRSPPASASTPPAAGCPEISWFRGGVAASDAVLTVSPQYTQELLQGGELPRDVASNLRRKGLKGILNGLDTGVWDPAADALLPQAVRYDASCVQQGKAAAKALLQQRLGLHVAPEVPLVAYLGRLEEQKGVDVLLGALPDLLGPPAAAVVGDWGSAGPGQQGRATARWGPVGDEVGMPSLHHPPQRQQQQQQQGMSGEHGASSADSTGADSAGCESAGSPGGSAAPYGADVASDLVTSSGSSDALAEDCDASGTAATAQEAADATPASSSSSGRDLRPLQLLVLGKGQGWMEAVVQQLATAYPGRAVGVAAFNEPLAHLLLAGADYLLVPSRSEPCGLVALAALRYGTLPIAAATGGLVDIMQPEEAGTLFEAPGDSSDAYSARRGVNALVAAVRGAGAGYQTAEFHQQRVRAMGRQVGWQVPASAWEEQLLSVVGASTSAALPSTTPGAVEGEATLHEAPSLTDRNEKKHN